MTEGPPACLSVATLHSICASSVGERIVSVAHRRIPSHRDAALDSPIVAGLREALAERAVYRIHLRTVSGRRWSLILKNDITPAGISEAQQWWWFGNVRHGREAPMEALIYQDPTPLAGMIPEVYDCLELEPGRHYQYVLEDASDHEPARSPGHLLRVAATLPRLHGALREWAARVGLERLSRSDLMYPQRTADIDRCAIESSDRLVATIRDLWHRLLDLAETPEYRGLQELTAIHGDLASPNVLVHPTDPASLKIIDWEAVVSGRAHSDLAHLLMREGPATEAEAVAAYARNDPSRSLSEHWRLYRWCKLEYCVLKAIEAVTLAGDGPDPAPIQVSVDADHAIRQAQFYGELFGSLALDRSPDAAARHPGG